MSVNEHKEFEAINKKTSERNAQATAVCHSTEEIYRAKKAKAKTKAFGCIAITGALAAAAVSVIEVLENIGWINEAFSLLLMCLAVCVAMFKVGYFWHEIKK